MIGQDSRALKDSTGNAYGLELYAAGQKPEGQITRSPLCEGKAWSDKTPVPKVSFVERAGDIYCGVGYYK